ncbi:hypothetical protein ACFYY8_06290 [Streptosporangium sp. NPDC001559]|uniref:hypothetical protein n=1 Tax=Streptosporangium sp. NPDC001559 TaxID=3366187 RepID=UPI0036E5E690
MAVFRCGRFPEGDVPIHTTKGLVEFRGGRAVVDDPEVAAALREVPDVFGITEEGRREPPAGRPAQSAPKAAWVGWAVGHGMDRSIADGLTKTELIGLADQIDPDPEED